MVRTMVRVMNFLSTYSRRDRAKESIPVQNRFRTVVMIVLDTEISAACQISGSFRIRS
jgi:hypothetical protein